MRLGIGMSKSVVFTVALCAACLFTLASSVSADPVRVPPGQVKLNLFEVQTSQLSDLGKADIRAMLSDHFANNNGNHFGFRNQLSDSFAAKHGRHVDSSDEVSDPFAGNNGKHLGFSVASNRGGMRFGLLDPRNPQNRTGGDNNSRNSVTQSPEPTGMLLLGTGLAAGAAFLRRRMRRKRTVEE